MKRMMKTVLVRRWIPAAILFLALQSPAWAHAFLYYAEPKVGGTVTNSPAEVKICFTEHVNPHGSVIQVWNAKGKEVDKKNSHVDAHYRALLSVSLPPLSDGTYTVTWHAVSMDKHETQGQFEFTIKHARK